MFGAKLLLPLVAGGLALAFAGSKKASAATPSSRSVPSPTTGKLTTEQVVQRMQTAIASADPAVINALADNLEKNGFATQAADLRAVAIDLQKVGANAAGVAVPPFVPTKQTTAPASIPTVAPSPQIVVPPPPSPPQGGSPATISLPNQTIFGSAPSSAANKLAASVVLDQSTKPKWKENRDLTSTFQSQESALGHYVNVVTGEPGKVDGLYGPGTALAIAKFYGIVPPNPKYWPTNYAPALKAYRNELLKLAAADPARADEWNQAAQKAKVS